MCGQRAGLRALGNLLCYRETVEFLVAAPTEVDRGLEDHGLEREECARLTSHGAIIGRYLPISQECDIDRRVTPTSTLHLGERDYIFPFVGETVTGPARSRSEDAKYVAWLILLAVGIGALVGGLIGGVGGRIVMLILRLGSNGSVRGLDTDDGFEIGQFTSATIFLLTVTAGLGGATGVVYLAVRNGLPRRGRAAVVGVFVAVVSGASTLDPYSLDFTILDPKPFAVASFVLLPGTATFVIAVAIEHLLSVEPWSRRGLTILLGLASLPLVPVGPLLVLAGAVAFALRRVPKLAAPARRLAIVAVPVAVVALAGWSAVELWRDLNAIL